MRKCQLSICHIEFLWAVREIVELHKFIALSSSLIASFPGLPGFWVVIFNGSFTTSIDDKHNQISESFKRLTVFLSNRSEYIQTFL